MSEPAVSFINSLSASMAGSTVEEYIQREESLAGKLDLVERLIGEARVTCVEEYRKWMGLKSMLSSLFCFTFNNKKPEFDRVSELESRIGRKLATFASRHGRASGETASAIRYLFARKYYPSVDKAAILLDLARGGYLLKSGRDYLVTGLHLSTGDNCFGVSYDGKRQWRLRRRTCAIQAFFLPCKASEMAKQMEEAGEICVPELDEGVHTKTSVGDGKFCAVINCSRKDYEAVRNRYSSFRRP